jgi:transposase-like protein
MTDDKISLRALLEKGSDAAFLREMIGFAAQRLMELKSESRCGAGHGERSADRRNQRNGSRTVTGSQKGQPRSKPGLGYQCGNA